jgi:hypothetical protein
VAGDEALKGADLGEEAHFVHLRTKGRREKESEDVTIGTRRG